MDESTEATHPAVVPETGDALDRDVRREGERHPESDPDALARLSDPSIASRRDQIATKVKDRSGLQWVPAGELLRRGTQRAGDVVARGQEYLHRAVRDRTVDAAQHAASIATKRVKALGRPLPTAKDQRATVATRDAAS